MTCDSRKRPEATRGVFVWDELPELDFVGARRLWRQAQVRNIINPQKMSETKVSEPKESCSLHREPPLPHSSQFKSPGNACASLCASDPLWVRPRTVIAEIARSRTQDSVKDRKN